MQFKIIINNQVVTQSVLHDSIRIGDKVDIRMVGIGPRFEVFIKDRRFGGVGTASIGFISANHAKTIFETHNEQRHIEGKIKNVFADHAYNGEKVVFTIEVI